MVKDLIEKALGSRVVALSPLPVGFGLAGYKLGLADGRTLAVKARQGPAHADLRLEAYMLGELAHHSELPVPAVHIADPDLLVMDFIETDGGGVSSSAERHSSRGGADRSPACDAAPLLRLCRRDTLIGPLPQPNPEASLWIPFFREHRLLAMARAAHAEGCLAAKLLIRLERLGERLGDYLIEPLPQASFMATYGQGMCSCAGTGLRALSIPLFIVGHPEIELAFTTMFGTFGRVFSTPMAPCGLWSPGFTSSA